MTRALGTIGLILSLADPVPTSAADVKNGEALARRWCSSCHVVAGDQSGTVGEAPPFRVIARTPDLDAGKIALFLLQPHPKMPDMGLSRQAAGDLAAYIMSLK
ncbi:MAG: cytochrome c [Xanthobacteraceae bacterium]|nr:cytochrome c [Xanthobacteraceae bacterium]